MGYKLIIFRNDEGGVSIIYPARECLKTRTVEEIALKDVPAGKPFKIVSPDEIPSDLMFFDAWEVDENTLTDGVGSESNEFPPKE